MKKVCVIVKTATFLLEKVSRITLDEDIGTTLPKDGLSIST